MPNRILKESICTSETIAQLSPTEEVFFYRLLVQCDDYGRMDARPQILRARCYPLALDSMSDDQVRCALAALVRAGLIALYTVDSKLYLQVTTWDKHQQVRAQRSKYPPMTSGVVQDTVLLSDDSTRNHAVSDVPENPNPNPNPNRESESGTVVSRTSARESKRPAASHTPQPPLPPQAQKFVDNGGLFPSGKMSDGTPKRDRAIQYICQNVRDDPDSLDLWGRVVAGYCATWSAKSYTVMVQDYYLVGRVPGEPQNNQRARGAPAPKGVPDEYSHMSPMMAALAMRRKELEGESHGKPI